MRILFVTPYYLPEVKFGGPPKKIQALARGLAARGHVVKALTFDSEKPRSDRKTEIDGIEVQCLPWIGRGLKQLPTNFRLIRHAVAESDLVHCYGLYNLISPIASFIANRCHRPLLNEPLGMYPPRARSRIVKGIFNSLITRPMLRRSSLVVAASENEANDLRRIAEARRIVVRRNGIDLSEFSQLPSGRALRNRWAIGPDQRVVVYLGRISPIKNLKQLVVAFDAVRQSNVRLLLVGPLSEPSYEKELRRIIHERGLEGSVFLTGPVYGEDQKAVFDLADLVVLPSVNESFGNAAAEAVAAGVPVLLTETCGVAPLIHKRAGLAVPLGLESLANGLKGMLDPDTRSPLMAQSDQVKRELSWDEPVRQTELLYTNIFAGAGVTMKMQAAVS
jgi:glycosyltransferase involved in cell wall biosynthesis